jgi:hypothetical protein
VDHRLQNVKQIYIDYLPYGFAPEIERAAPMPQVEHKLHVRVDKMIRFSHPSIVICRALMNAENLPSGLKLDIIK